MKLRIILWLLFPTLLQAQYNVWNKLNDVGMGKRERAVGFALMGKGYLFGGQDTAEVIHKDLWSYDPATDIWTQKADMPGSARRDAVSFTIGNYAYVGSGMDSVSAPTGITLKDFWRYNPSFFQSNYFIYYKAESPTSWHKIVGICHIDKIYICMFWIFHT